MKKLKAFTLMELMIGMIIGSIVVGFCYNGYSIISKQFIDYKKIKKDVNQAILLNEILTNDFSRAEQVVLNENKLMMQSDSSIIVYEIDSAFILRTDSGLVDTFHFAISDLQPVFINQEAENIGIIKNISFQTKVLGEEESFSYAKEYSSAFLMNQITIKNGN